MLPCYRPAVSEVESVTHFHQLMRDSPDDEVSFVLIADKDEHKEHDVVKNYNLVAGQLYSSITFYHAGRFEIPQVRKFGEMKLTN